VVRDATGLGPQSFGAVAQTELNFRLGSGPFYFRLDLDMQMASFDPDQTALGLPEWAVLTNGIKLGPPEYAMLQIGREDYMARLGIITHQIGLEDWDSWATYFPSRSTLFNVLPGRMLGVEPAIVVGEGYEIFAFGGLDLDYDLPDARAWVAGAGLTTLQEVWGTWSGVAAFPTLDYYVAATANEFYPMDELSFAVDGAVGLVGNGDGGEFKQFFGADLVVNVLPAEVLQPSFRVQAFGDPDDAYANFYFEQPSVSASAALTARLFDGWFKVSVEGKASKIADEIVPGLFTMASLHRPEPPPFSAKEEEAKSGSGTRVARGTRVTQPALVAPPPEVALRNNRTSY